MTSILCERGLDENDKPFVVDDGVKIGAMWIEKRADDQYQLRATYKSGDQWGNIVVRTFTDESEGTQYLSDFVTNVLGRQLFDATS